MKLRTQLLLIALLMLVLPLTGWQFARQVERTLRAGHAEALETSARTVARQIAESSDQLPQLRGPAIYIHQPGSPPILDGYSDDWTGFVNDQAIQPGPSAAVQLMSAEYGNAIFFLFEVRSDQQIYSLPGQNNGDQLQLEFRREDGLLGAVDLIPLAPGFVETRGQNSEGWPRVQGYWQPGARGWTVELQLPNTTDLIAIGWRLIDAQSSNSNPPAREFSSGGNLALVRPNQALANQLAATLPDQTRAWITLPSSWVVAHAERGGESQVSKSEPSWIDTLLFEGLASDSITASPMRDARTVRIDSLDPTVRSTWTTRPNQPGVVLSASAPITSENAHSGYVLLEREADQLLLDSNRAVLRLLGISLGLFVLVAVLLLGYATWLSERVRRLRDELEASVGDDGQVKHTLKPARRGDELGDLGRSVSRLLARLREHQIYLRTLADKLAHELRTPLAMIRSSLDNLEEVHDPIDIERYRQRASEGSDRLNRIFQAMSQAARIEESLAHEDMVALDMNQFLSSYLAACRDTYPERRFRLIAPNSGHVIRAAPDLLAQLMDKLMDNAVDFSPSDSTIRLRLRRSAHDVEIDIENDGPALPENSATLFDAMVSVREKKGGNVHLGLGLNIVRLIAEHHQGSVQASNINNGVRFRVRLPVP